MREKKGRRGRTKRMNEGKETDGLKGTKRRGEGLREAKKD